MKVKLALMLQLFYTLSYAQELPTVVPPSPNASALAEYADIPVNNYTGIPNISIPLFRAKSGKIEMPITLSYHASGIKVAQEASNVGLGWVLNAGGVITRQLRGVDDFDNTYGYIKTTLPPATADNLPDWSSDVNYYLGIYNNIKQGNFDSGPDIFYYNFLGYSGKLVFEKQLHSGDIVTATPIDQNNLSFTYNIYQKTWTITDGNGWKYYLGSSSLNAVETTESHGSSSTEAPIYPTNSRIVSGEPRSSNSAWYLTKIITPEGDKIEFLYETGSEILSQIGRSEELHDLLQLNYKNYGGFNIKTIHPLLSSRYTLYTASQQVTEPVYLKKINFQNGFIEFTYEDREDIRLYDSNATKPQRIKSLKLFTTLPEKLIKQVDFNYSYFSAVTTEPNLNNPERKKRLKLNSIQETFINEQDEISVKPPYLFSYNSTLLPEKTSHHIDAWGYYNGKNNSHIPYYNVNNQDSGIYPIILSEPRTYETYKMLSPFYEGQGIGSDDLYLRGANRNIDETKAKASILESIQYPIGAVDHFEYESNDYYNETESLYNDVPISISAIVNYEEWSSDEVVFTLDKLTFVNLWFKIINLSSININENMTAVLEDSNGNVLVTIAPGQDYLQNIDFQTNVALFLPAGSYKLKVTNNTSEGSLIIEAKAEYIKKNLTTKKKGGGLRIKSITSKNNGFFVKKKEYSYEDNNNFSTGRLISPFRFFYNEIQSVGNSVDIYTGQYLVRTSDSAIPFGNSAQGNVVGYDCVKVSSVDSDNNKLGVSEYFYRNEEEKPVEMFTPGVPTLINLSNGQLLEERYYNENGDKVREKTTTYIREDVTTKMLKGVQIHGFFLGNNANQIRFYDMYSEWWHPQSSTEAQYDLNGENPIVSTIYYDYENSDHKNITKTTTVNSKGQTIITVNKYPQDLQSGINDTSASIVSNMIADNVINPVLKTEAFIDGNLVEGIINNYKEEVHTNDNNEVNNMYLPLNIKTLKRGTTSSYEQRVEYVKYDDNGKIQEVKKSNGSSISYIWGYNNQYLVAKIENQSLANIPTSLYNDVVSKSNLDDDTCLDFNNCNEKNLRTALNNLRNDTALANALVTAYTYDPLVGITSVIDAKGYTTYYEYDDFNRLEFVKDAQGHLISEDKYNYKKQ